MKREVRTASSCSRSLSGGPGQGMEKPTASIQPPAAARGAQLSTTRLQPRESSQGILILLMLLLTEEVSVGQPLGILPSTEKQLLRACVLVAV